MDTAKTDAPVRMSCHWWCQQFPADFQVCRYDTLTKLNAEQDRLRESVSDPVLGAE